MTKILLVLALFQQVQQQDTIPLINSSEIIQDAYRLTSEEKYDSAITQLIKVHPEDSNFNVVNYQLITAYIRNGQSEKGDSLALYLEENLPVGSSFYVQYGNAYTNTDQFDKALSIYQEGLKKFPFNHYLLYNTGYLKSRQGKYDEALQYIQEAIKIKPFYSPAHQILGNLCVSLGFRSKALLSYATYLAINPDKNWALVRMNDLVNDAFREEGSITSNELDNSDFEFYDNLSKSKAAMDDRFKSQVDFEAPVAQQFELFMKKLSVNQNSSDFWMKNYVPAFVKMEQEGLTADFIYYLLTSTNDEGVNSYLEKNAKAKDAWIDIINTYFTENREVHERTLAGKTALYNHWYRNNNSLSAVGNQTGEKRTGPWVYYYENDFKNAEGVYADHGDKTGTWYYYHENGRLRSEEFHDETGLVQGEIKRYSEEGILSSITTYKDDSLHGSWQGYFECGQVNEIYPYNNGQGEGDGIVYYKNGSTKTEYKLANSMLEGEYLSYHLNGQVSNRSSYSEDNREGDYLGYYYDGQLSEKGSYANGLATGMWEYYHDNGQLSSKGEYIDGNRTGEWNHYYSDGTQQTKEYYGEDGLLEGTSYLYSLAGKVYAERTYSKDVLVGYKYFDQQGETLYEQNDPSGSFDDYRFYYPTGVLKTKGRTVEGALNGPFESYHINGKVQQEGTMKDGNWDGLYREYDEAGNLIYLYTNNAGTPNGYYRSFYANGQIKTEGWIADGKEEQRWKEYWMDGTIKGEYYYVNGQFEGIVKEYGPKGRLFEENIYVRGEQRKIIQYDTSGVVYHTMDIYDSNGGKSTTKYVDGGDYFSSSYSCGELTEDINFFYPDGSLLIKYEVSNTQYHGEYLGYDPLGKLSGKGQYENNNQEGEWVFYYHDGTVESKYTYRQDERDGKAYDYYENGNLKVESNYLDNEQHGQRTMYGPGGKIMLIKYYVKDHGPVGYQYETQDGSLSDIITIPVSGRFELKSYYQNGKVAVIQPYNNNHFDGDLIYYDEEGNVIRRTTYKNGDRQGDNKHFYSNGNVKLVIPNYYGEEHGEVLQYYENGKLRESEEYNFGVRNGWRRLFSEDGKLLKEMFYWNDRIYSK